MYCENCNKEHDGSYGSGRFCSVKCSRGFSTKSKRNEINNAVSLKLQNTGHSDIEKICPICEEVFFAKWNKRTQTCCSKSCSLKLRGGWEKLSADRWSIINRNSHANGHNVSHGGNTKWFEHNGIKVQGSYELRTCKILDAWKGIKIKNWEYTSDRIPYVKLDGKIHTYLLDFKVFLDDHSFYYIEVKGYERPNDKLKWQAVREKGIKLEVWFENDIREKEIEIGSLAQLVQ